MATLIIPQVNLTEYGFVHGVGTAWFYPPSNQDYHIHVEASTGPGVPAGSVKITSVSIKTPGVNGGQNLRQCQVGTNAGKFGLNTPNIQWGEDAVGFKNVLRNSGIGYP
ncbi:MAG TPA: hypothetical protein VGB07_10805 [Blastocatellia bacterium]